MLSVRTPAQPPSAAHIFSGGYPACASTSLTTPLRPRAPSPVRAHSYPCAQAYLDAWLQEQQQQEQQRQMGLAQLMQQQMLLQQQRAIGAWQQQQQQQEEEQQQGMVLGGPVADLLDLLLAPFQEEASGCRHHRQQQQQQQMEMMHPRQPLQGEQEPTMRVTFLQDRNTGARAHPHRCGCRQPMCAAGVVWMRA